MPLRIAAKIPGGETVYFKKQLEPHIDGRTVQLVGEVDEVRKQPFLAEAAALLFPIDWPEPFGLVMIEAMACGTPVIAYRSGSVPEVVEDGVTGFIVENEEQAVRAVGDLGRLDRRKVRARFEERFSADRMAREYESAYRALISAAAGHSAAARVAKAERRLETNLTDELPVSSQMLMGRSLRVPVKSATVQRKATRPGQGQRGGTRDWQPPLLPSHRHRAEPRRRPKPEE
jgi:Glycosyl transferases group 1